MQLSNRSRFLSILFSLLTSCSTKAELFKIPPAEISDAGRKLIMEYEGCDLRPQWAGGASGVDMGYGYDAGYYSKPVILTDWSMIPIKERTAFADTSGQAGRKAKAIATALSWIRIWGSAAEKVFLNVDVPREYDRCSRAFPGFQALRPNAQAALMSLGYNRGYAMLGDGRKEMRAIRDLVPKKDYEGIAGQFRAMTRIWNGTSIGRGMYRRRYAEADLVLKA